MWIKHMLWEKKIHRLSIHSHSAKYSAKYSAKKDLAENAGVCVRACVGGGGEGALGEPEAKAEPNEGCHDAVSPPSIVSFPGSSHTFIVLGEYGGLRRCSWVPSSWRPGYPRLLRVEVTV